MLDNLKSNPKEYIGMKPNTLEQGNVYFNLKGT